MAVSIAAEYCADLPNGKVRSAFSISLDAVLRQHGVWLAIIATIAILPRLWVIANTPAPARDILRIVNAAKGFESKSFASAVRSVPLHPAYPMLLVGVRRTLEATTGISGPAAWRRSGEIVNLVAYVAFLFAAYFAGSMLWNCRIAGLGVIALSCVPRQARYSCDVLSDGLHAAIWMGSFALFVSHLHRPNRTILFAAGFLAGAAFWTRPEALLLPMIIVATLLIRTALRASIAGWREFARELAIYVLSAGIIIAAYMILLGSISPKNTARALVGQSTYTEPGLTTGDLLHLPGASAPHPPDVPVKTSWLGAVGNVIDEFGQETRGLLALLAAVALIRTPLSLPAPAPRILVVMSLSGFVGMLTVLQMRAGFISGRYLLPVLPLVAMLAIVGANLVVRWVQRLPRLPWERSWTVERLTGRRALAARFALGAIFTAMFLPKWCRPLHEGCVAHAQAAAWLNEHSDRGERIFDPSRYVGFLADRPFTQRLDQDEPSPRLAVIDAAIVHQVDAETHRSLAEIAAKGTLLATFPHGAKTNVDVFIYSLPGRGARQPAMEEVQ